MTKITIEVCQCDFCGIQEITLPECVVCGKHMCKKHRTGVLFGVYNIRERTDKLSSVFKEERYLCPECLGDRKEVYLKLAEELITEAEKVPEEPVEPEIPK